MVKIVCEGVKIVRDGVKNFREKIDMLLIYPSSYMVFPPLIHDFNYFQAYSEVRVHLEQHGAGG